MHIIKQAEYEDDSYYFIIDRFDRLAKVKNKGYLRAKRNAFKNRDISISDEMLKYKDRPSFHSLALESDLSGTIYTHSAEQKNRMCLDDMLETIVREKNTSRRCVIRLADTFFDYMNGVTNTSCLNIIHYTENDVKLFFRASDMRFELLYDILLIKEFFIDPVYKKQQPRIHVIASTAQNIINIEELLNNNSI